MKRNVDPSFVKVDLAHLVKLAAFLVAVALVSLGMTILYDNLSTYPEVLRFFLVHKEASLPTWVSTILLFMGALLSWLNYCAERTYGQRSKLLACGWLFLSFVFLGLSSDEAAMIHERIGGFYNDLTTSGQLPFRPGWFLTAYAPLIVVTVIFMTMFFLKLQKDRRGVTLAFVGLGVWINSLVFEKIDGVIRQGADFRGNFLFCLVRYITEFSEIFGTAIWSTS